MAILLLEGWSGLTTTTAATKGWTFSGSTTAISSTGGRRGGYALYNSSTGSITASKGIATSTSVYAGMAASISTSSTVSSTLISVIGDVSGSVGGFVKWNASTNKLEAYGYGSVLCGTSTNTMAPGSGFHYIEFYVLGSTTTGGAIIVKVDGAEWINVSGFQTMAATPDTGYNQIKFNNFYATSATPSYVDDIYVSSSAFLGDCRIDPMTVDSDGSTVNFTPLSGTNASNVDDATHDSDTTYNSSSTLNHLDLYGMTNPTAVTGSTIHAIQVTNFVRKDDTGARSTAVVVKSGATTSVGSDQQPGTSYAAQERILEVDPNTSAAWTEANLNSVECGIKITV